MTLPVEPAGRDDDALDAAGGHDVVIGPTRRRWPVVVVVGLAALVVASIASGGGGARTAPTTSVPVVGSTTTQPRATVTSLPVTTSTVSTPVTVAPLPFGKPTGVVIYLTPAGGAPDTLRVYDIDSGVVHDVDLRLDVGWFIRVVEGAGGAVVDGGAITVVSHGAADRPLDASGTNGFADGPDGRVAAGPDGGVWVRGYNPEAIELVDASGRRTGRRFSLPAGSELFGSVADGRPVVRSPDGHLALVGDDGTRTPFADNALRPVERGRFVEVRCDTEQRCGALAHIDDREVDLGPLYDDHGAPRRFVMQPDGPFVAIVANGVLSLFDAATGTTVATAVNGSVNEVSGGNERDVRFLPGGLGVVAQTNGSLLFVDLAGRTVAVVPFDPGTVPGSPVLGVGTARVWAP